MTTPTDADQPVVEAPTDSGQNVAQPVEVYAPYAVEGNDTSAYLGVSTEYMTYASETDRPMRAEGNVDDDPEVAAEERYYETATPVLVLPAVESQQTTGAGSLHETVYTATSGEDYSAVQAVTEDSGAPVEGDVVKEENPADTAGTETVTSPTGTVDAATPNPEQKMDPEAPAPPPPPATSTTKTSKSTGTADNTTTTGSSQS